jgi:hypothetical protein
MNPKETRWYWILSFASLLSPFVFFSAVLLFQKMSHPGELDAGGAGSLGYAALMQILFGIGLGCSVGMSLNIVKMKKFAKKGMLEYLAFLMNSLALIGITYSMVRIQG